MEVFLDHCRVRGIYKSGGDLAFRNFLIRLAEVWESGAQTAVLSPRDSRSNLG